MNSTPSELGRLIILGAGPAGLAGGYFSVQAGVQPQIFEAAGRVGGNAITHRHGDFRFDSGAHRFHDKDPETTAVIQDLLGEDLLECNLPSQIMHGERWIDFPLSPLNVLRSLGWTTCLRVASDWVRAQRSSPPAVESLQSRVLRAYGRTLAELFILPYSAKLWGLPCNRLSPSVSGGRLKGMNPVAFLREAIGGQRAKVRHLDGRFYYPKWGFGTIAEALADRIGRDAIELNSRITRVLHDGTKVETVEINGERSVPVEQLINTLPITAFLRLLDPKPPEAILRLADGLRFRNVILVAISLNRRQVTSNGSIYFPDGTLPITRVYEPKNRSAFMAPAEQTQLVAELPCDPADALWHSSDASLVEQVTSHLEVYGLVQRSEVIDGCVRRMSSAYPVLEIGSDDRMARIQEWIATLQNVETIGRGGQFAYTHVHDLIASGRTAALAAVERLAPPSLVHHGEVPEFTRA